MKTEDNKLSKNIRPALLIWTMLIFTVVIFWDAIDKDFSVKSGYLDILQLVLVAEIGFYFTSRGWEKVSSVKECEEQRKKDQKDQKDKRGPIKMQKRRPDRDQDDEIEFHRPDLDHLSDEKD